jgi:hypothetical protein
MIKKQAGQPPDFSREDRLLPAPERKRPMPRTILIAAALLCAAPAAFAQELTAARRDACTGDYEKYCKGTVPGASSPASTNPPTSSRRPARKCWLTPRRSRFASAELSLPNIQ